MGSIETPFCTAALYTQEFKDVQEIRLETKSPEACVDFEVSKLTVTCADEVWLQIWLQMCCCSWSPAKTGIDAIQWEKGRESINIFFGSAPINTSIYLYTHDQISDSVLPCNPPLDSCLILAVLKCSPSSSHWSWCSPGNSSHVLTGAAVCLHFHSKWGFTPPISPNLMLQELPLGERSCEGRNSLMDVLGFQNTALESRAELEVTQEMPLVSSREKSVVWWCM